MKTRSQTRSQGRVITVYTEPIENWSRVIDDSPLQRLLCMYMTILVPHGLHAPDRREEQLINRMRTYYGYRKTEVRAALRRLVRLQVIQRTTQKVDELTLEIP